MSNSLTQGQRLEVDQRLVSSNKEFFLIMQRDGNLVLYSSSNQKALWATGTNGTSATYVIMQDGELLLKKDRDRVNDQFNYSSGGSYWWAGKSTGPGSSCTVMDDGNFVIQDAQKRVVWATNTAQQWIPQGRAATTDKVYFLKNVGTNLHLYLDGCIEVGACTPNKHNLERWILRDLGDNRYALEHFVTGGRLDSDADSWDDTWAAVYTKPKNDNRKNQQWMFEGDRSSFILRNVETQQFLIVTVNRDIHAISESEFEEFEEFEQVADSLHRKWKLVEATY